MGIYPAKYTDKFGIEETSISNDGKVLRMMLRGVEFVGSDFDGFEPPDGVDADQLARFPLRKWEQFSVWRSELCSYRLECSIPVVVSNIAGVDSPAILQVELVLGDPLPEGGLDSEMLHLSLSFGLSSFKGSGTSGWFEDEMLEIQAQLPKGVFIKSCINCLFSDYSPCGHGLFGGMICFRNKKAEYLKVKSKGDLLMLHGRSDPYVQETFLCPEFERRVPGTGYRG